MSLTQSDTNKETDVIEKINTGEKSIEEDVMLAELDINKS